MRRDRAGARLRAQVLEEVLPARGLVVAAGRQPALVQQAVVVLVAERQPALVQEAGVVPVAARRAEVEAALAQPRPALRRAAARLPRQGLAADEAREARLAPAQVVDRVLERKAPERVEDAAAMVVNALSADEGRKAAATRGVAVAISNVAAVTSSAANASAAVARDAASIVANASAAVSASGSFRPIAARSSDTASAGAGATFRLETRHRNWRRSKGAAPVFKYYAIRKSSARLNATIEKDRHNVES